MLVLALEVLPTLNFWAWAVVEAMAVTLELSGSLVAIVVASCGGRHEFGSRGKNDNRRGSSTFASGPWRG